MNICRHPLEKVGEGNLGRLGLGVNDFAALIVSALEACLVRQLLFMAMGAFRKGQLVKMVMGAASTRAPLRMSPLWIRHFSSS